MEEALAYVHPNPISPDVLTRYKVKKEPLQAWVLREFTGSETDDDFIMSYAPGYVRQLDSRPMPMWGRFRASTTNSGNTYATSNLEIHVLHPQLDRHVEQDPRALLGVVWCTSFDLSQLPTHVLLTYRDQLDFMPSDQLPYLECGLMSSDSWRAEVLLICY
ncbi:hypothetical protein M9H77_21046 [Catharanthus roseus]|uniref:Uncharacterized protein n=1 Tax=Catharanthus roseus TaxID=4058 RepID=A0ACC0AL82_CATRO|nr:hypothetical protein M9H77_21046 [Catharanthus roseus]